MVGSGFVGERALGDKRISFASNAQQGDIAYSNYYLEMDMRMDNAIGHENGQRRSRRKSLTHSGLKVAVTKRLLNFFWLSWQVGIRR